MNTLIRLIIIILRNGNFRHSGIDIAAKRSKALESLTESKRPVREAKLRRELMKNPFLGRLIAEGAFLKNSFRTRGGHLYAPECDLAYVRIPRSASTSLSKAMLFAMLPRLKDQQLTSEQINFLADHYLKTGLDRQQHLPEIFTVVRNPFERIVSVYRTFFEFAHEPFVYQDYLFGILQQNFSFNQFVKTLRLIPDRLKDQHVKPQHYFLRYYEQANIPVRIMRLEEPETIARFLREHGMPFESMNRSGDYDYRRYYDRETFEEVLKLYESDVTRFDYRKVVQEIQFSIEHTRVQM